MSKLHIHGQDYYHEPAFIVGTPESLVALKKAIDRALQKEAAISNTFASDGEGYSLVVIKVEDTDKYWDNPLLPYSDEMCKNPFAWSGPYDLLKKLYQNVKVAFAVLTEDEENDC